MATSVYQPNPKLDLVLERIVDVPRESIWRAWTTPEILKQWFTPKPWITADCEINLTPGGIFRTIMRSPEGVEHQDVCCYLEIVPNEKLVWTDMLIPDYRPAQDAACDVWFTARLTLQPEGARTKYTLVFMHKNEADCTRHRDMGFHDGFGMALDQLVAVAKKLESLH
jgi:uncharacterized protein YndB with AHSA1/START domain